MKKVLRVCGALINKDKILMVNHQHDNLNYWTLPGGAVEYDETLEEAVSREFMEETNLLCHADAIIFDEEFKTGVCRCFLMKTNEPFDAFNLGYDPGELHLPKSERMLKAVEWKRIENFRDDKQVSNVIDFLEINVI